MFAQLHGVELQRPTSIGCRCAIRFLGLVPLQTVFTPSIVYDLRCVFTFKCVRNLCFNARSCNSPLVDSYSGTYCVEGQAIWSFPWAPCHKIRGRPPLCSAPRISPLISEYRYSPDTVGLLYRRTKTTCVVRALATMNTPGVFICCDCSDHYLQ
jgi:hypothetical protein